jgi:hypothetical protein
MTYTTGQKIQAADYNTIAWTNPSIGGHWGIGSGDRGLGQSTSTIDLPPGINPVVASTKITAVQWSNLLSTINTTLRHYGQPLVSLAPYSITVGQPIKAFAALATNSALAYNSAGSTTSYIGDGAAYVTPFSGNWGSTAQGANKTLSFTHTVTFTSGDAARYFFNAGGLIKLTFSRTGGTTNAINSSWTGICASPGTIAFGYRNTTRSGAGSSNIILNNNNGGYHSGTSTFVTHFRQNDLGGGYYGLDYLKVDYKWSGTLSNGGYPVMNITTSMVNVAGVVVNGLTSVSLVASTPTTGAGLANTWGTPVIAGSAATN